MSTLTIPTVRPSVPAVTPEDLLQMEDRGLFELVDGQLIEKKMSYTANLVAGRIAFSLVSHANSTKAGDTLPEQSFRCFPRDPSQVRRPDVAFILASRVPQSRPTGHVEIVPDIAVEVVSPNDSVYEVDEKLADYESAAIPLVWVVNPEARIIKVRRPGQPTVELHDGQTLTAEEILPGFAVNVTDLLPVLPKPKPQ